MFSFLSYRADILRQSVTVKKVAYKETYFKYLNFVNQVNLSMRKKIIHRYLVYI